MEGDGYRVETIVFESRPGLLVTANLYLPAKPTKSMPAVLFSHSHHNPKTQGELQDMGMTWAPGLARAGNGSPGPPERGDNIHLSAVISIQSRSPWSVRIITFATTWGFNCNWLARA